jgi:large subunit ribosomal protein L46
MNERTAMPFPRYFYIHQETPAEVDWKRKIADRKTPARDIGKWSAWDRDQGWNDELLVGSTISEPLEHVQRLLEDAKVHEEAAGEDSSDEKVVIEQPLSRATDADRRNDTRSLQRDLARTLYLLVLPENGRWQFPSALIEGSESLYRVCVLLSKAEQY